MFFPDQPQEPQCTVSLTQSPNNRRFGFIHFVCLKNENTLQLFLIYYGLIFSCNRSIKSHLVSNAHILLFIELRYGRPFTVIFNGWHRLERKFWSLDFEWFYFKTNGNFIIVWKFTKVTSLSWNDQFLRHVNWNFTSFVVIFLVSLITHFQFLKIIVFGIDFRFTAKFYF